MVQAALLTGARYGELTGVCVRDFDAGAAVLWLRETKSSVRRAVYLDEEGAALFRTHTRNRPTDALIFPRPDGKRWGASQQARPLATGCLKAHIEPAGFHDLRRTYGARMALKGVPMAVIAQALGHADERITRKHYAHLSPSYLAETIRAGVAGLGIIQPALKVVKGGI
jgi:integrase